MPRREAALFLERLRDPKARESEESRRPIHEAGGAKEERTADHEMRGKPFVSAYFA